MAEQRPQRHAEVRPPPAFRGSVAAEVAVRAHRAGWRGGAQRCRRRGGERGAPGCGAPALGGKLWHLLPVNVTLCCPGGLQSSLSYRCLASLLDYPKDNVCVVEAGN